MGTFEYLLMFASVILGLAVSDVAISLHRLAVAHHRVRWDVLAPLAALVAFLKIVTQWWTWFSAAGVAKVVTFEMYFAVLTEAVLLFLLAATTLPDEIPADGIDLKAYWEGARRRFWLLFLVQWTLWAGVNLWIYARMEHAPTVAWTSYVIAPACLLLLFVRWRPLQAAALIGFTAYYFLKYFGQTLVR